MEEEHTQHDYKKEKFLETLALKEVLGNVTVACRRLGFGRRTVYQWRSDDAEFERRWDDIVLDSQEELADEAENQLRALVLKQHPTAIIFTLKNFRRQKFHEEKEVKPVDSDPNESHAKYLEWCKRHNLDPDTGLRLVSTDVETENSVQKP